MAQGVIMHQNTIAKLEAKELQVNLTSNSGKELDSVLLGNKLDQIEMQVDVKIETNTSFTEFIQDQIHTEIKVAEVIINLIKSDTLITKTYLKDKKGYNSRVNQILECIESQSVPSNWLAVANVNTAVLKTWLQKLEQILKYISGVCYTSKFEELHLGLLFWPDRFITQAKQAAARTLGVTMQEVCTVIQTSPSSCHS